MRFKVILRGEVPFEGSGECTGFVVARTLDGAEKKVRNVLSKLELELVRRKGREKPPPGGKNFSVKDEEDFCVEIVPE